WHDERGGRATSAAACAAGPTAVRGHGSTAPRGSMSWLIRLCPGAKVQDKAAWSASASASRSARSSSCRRWQMSTSFCPPDGHPLTLRFARLANGGADTSARVVHQAYWMARMEFAPCPPVDQPASSPARRHDTNLPLREVVDHLAVGVVVA